MCPNRRGCSETVGWERVTIYVDCKLYKGRLFVSEKTPDGQRKIYTKRPPYVFYYVDRDGSYRSIYGDPLRRVAHNNKREFESDLSARRAAGRTIFESDIHPVYRFLEEKFPEDSAIPPLNTSFFDIEVDKDPDRGWPTAENPYAEITAVTIYNDWEDQFYTLAVPPPNLSYEQARALLDSDPGDGFGLLTEENGYFLCRDEAELLLMLIELIQDADILTGYNSLFFDLPYVIHRIRMVLGGESFETIVSENGSEKNPFAPSEQSIPYLTKLSLFELLPEMKMVENFGKYEKVFKIFGRVHLDYLEIFRKFTKNTIGELHSYKLDYVLQVTIKQNKVPYDGSLDQLYRNDFRTFLAYNRQDVRGLKSLDDKLKLINLVNTMAHMAGVTLDKTLGSVAIIEQAVLRRLHRRGEICFDRKEVTDHAVIPGAYVVLPEKGLYEWVCSFDVASLYPSVIRLLNISPETVIGQFDLSRTDAKWAEHYALTQNATESWGFFTGVLEYHDLIEENDVDLTLNIEGSGDQITLPAKEWKSLLIENGWSISANGTVFDNSRRGIIAECMDSWFFERIASKKKAGTFAKKLEELKKKPKEEMLAVDREKIKQCEDEFAKWNTVQMAGKIFMNSTYGAFLNAYFRFNDSRLGRSVTLSGRCVTKHMIEEAERVIERRIEESSNGGESTISNVENQPTG